LIQNFRTRIHQNGGLKGLDLRGARLSEPYLMKAVALLKLANYEWLTILKLDGCQLSIKALS